MNDCTGGVGKLAKRLRVFEIFVDGELKQGELCGARSFEGCRDGGLWDSREAEFFIGVQRVAQ